MVVAKEAGEAPSSNKTPITTARTVSWRVAAILPAHAAPRSRDLLIAHTTSISNKRRPVKIEHTRQEKAADGIRTHNFYLGKVALYR